MCPLVSVILPTHNPDPERLERTLQGLARQTLPLAEWEILLVDNASTRPASADLIERFNLPNLRVLPEPQLGLTSARRRGFAGAGAPVAVLVDDDNVLAPDYLECALEILAQQPRVAIAGGRVRPEFAVPPPAWANAFYGLLALRDLGSDVLTAGLRRDNLDGRPQYPAFSPLGAGMVLRREAWAAWIRALDAGNGVVTDRRGNDLTSGGDNDIVFAALNEGWEVGYFPTLSLLHLIPAGRLSPEYLGRLNRGIQRSWVWVLARHGACPWPAVPAWTVPLRQARAWWRTKAWRGPVERITWEGLAGRLAGQGDLSNKRASTRR